MGRVRRLHWLGDYPTEQEAARVVREFLASSTPFSPEVRAA